MSTEKKNTLSLSVSAGVKKNMDNASGRVRQSFSHGKKYKKVFFCQRMNSTSIGTKMN